MQKWLKIKFSARGLHELYFIRRWGGGRVFTGGRLTGNRKDIVITGLCVLGGHPPALLGWAGCTGCSLLAQGRGGALQAELGQPGPE